MREREREREWVYRANGEKVYSKRNARRNVRLVSGKTPWCNNRENKKLLREREKEMRGKRSNVFLT